MEKPNLPAARHFADEVRALYAQGLQDDALWQRIKDAMRPIRVSRRVHGTDRPRLRARRP